MPQAMTFYAVHVGDVMTCKECAASVKITSSMQTHAELPHISHESWCPFICAVDQGPHAMARYLKRHGDPLVVSSPEAN